MPPLVERLDRLKVTAELFPRCGICGERLYRGPETQYAELPGRNRLAHVACVAAQQDGAA